MKTISFGATAAVILMAATAAHAQRAPARRAAAATAPATAAAPASSAVAPAGPPVVSGPPLAGVCVYSDDRAIGNSNAGKAAAARMNQLRAQVTAELQAEQTAIQTDGNALNAKRTTLTADQFQQQAAPIQARIEALDRKAQQRQRELEATGAKALQRIHVEIDPILRGVYQQRACSLLLNGEGVYLGNPAMDLSDTVTAQLNTKLPTISFDRENLPAQVAQ